MALVSPGLLNRIERKVGPKDDEGMFQIIRDTGPVMEGAGFKRSNKMVVETVAGRSTHMSDLNIGEKVRDSIVRGDADYIITLKAGTDILNDDMMREIAQAWTPGKYYFPNKKVISTYYNGLMYLCKVAGTSSNNEPDWGTTLGSITYDGTMQWMCMGPSNVFEVVEIASPSTFGDFISKRVMAKLQQL